MIELRAGDPVVTADLKIVPIEAVRCDCYPTKHGFCISAFKGPAYVVVVARSVTRAFDMSGDEVDAETVITEAQLSGVAQKPER